MSNAKIISIIDYENRVLRSDITAAIEHAAAAASAPLQCELDLLRSLIELLQQRVSKLEQEGGIRPGK